MKNEDQDTVLQKIKVEDSSELLSFLVEKKVRKSRSAVKSLLSHKQIKVNGRTATQFNLELQAGDVVTVHKSSNIHDVKQLDGVRVIYEDEFLIVVDKDARLLSIATDKEKTETAYGVLGKYLRINDPKARPFVLHRLDRDISGLMIYAKTSRMQELIQKDWNKYILKQSYVAVVSGRVNPSQGVVETWLTEDKNFVMHSSDKDNGGLKSVTHYEVLRSVRKYTMLQLVLETSRKNQIRVQMQHIGHPIVGDKKYGSTANPIKRMALHADGLSILHPATNEVMDFKSPIPEGMKKLLDVPKE